MTEIDGGRRTFFITVELTQHGMAVMLILFKSNAKIFHLGYLLLLDTIDAEDTESAELLECGSFSQSK